MHQLVSRVAPHVILRLLMQRAMIQLSRQMACGRLRIVAQVCAAWAVVLQLVAQRHTAHATPVSKLSPL